MSRCEECEELIENQDPVYCAEDYDLAIKRLREIEGELADAQAEVSRLRHLHENPRAVEAVADHFEHYDGDCGAWSRKDCEDEARLVLKAAVEAVEEADT